LNEREKQVVERCKMLLDALPQGETFDWVEQISIPMTIGMLLILFDMPYDEWRDIKRWSDYASAVSADNLNDEFRADFMEQMGQMLARFDRELEARRALPPSDDLLSRMIHSEAMGNMSPMERIANIALLIVGGNDTTRNSMSGLVEAFDKFPDQLDALHGDPRYRTCGPTHPRRREADHVVYLGQQGRDGIRGSRSLRRCPPKCSSPRRVRPWYSSLRRGPSRRNPDWHADFGDHRTQLAGCPAG